MFKFLTISDSYGRYELYAFQNDEGAYGTPALLKKEADRNIDDIYNDDCILYELYPYLKGEIEMPYILEGFVDKGCEKELIDIIEEGIRLGFFNATTKINEK